MNKVEFFRAKDPFSLEETINQWCKSQGREPISISLTYSDSDKWYVAAVVVKWENL